MKTYNNASEELEEGFTLKEACSIKCSDSLETYCNEQDTYKSIPTLKEATNEIIERIEDKSTLYLLISIEISDLPDKGLDELFTKSIEDAEDKENYLSDLNSRHNPGIETFSIAKEKLKYLLLKKKFETLTEEDRQWIKDNSYNV